MYQGNGIQQSSKPINMKGNALRQNGTRHNNNKSMENHSVNSTPIPIKGKVRQSPKLRRRSTTESTDSTDSNPSTPYDVEHSPVHAFSRSFSNSGHSGSNLNVYSMSPRSTSVMFQYYSTPRRYYQNPSAINNNRGCYSNDYTNGYSKRPLSRTISECKTPDSPVLSGIPPTLQQDVMEDPRRRAYSESDKKVVNSSMHMSRLSALKKLKKKLARSGSLRSKHNKEEGNDQSSDKSLERINSLEKVEEGRPFRSRLVDQNSNHCPVKRNIFSEEDEVKFSGLTIDEENTKKHPEVHVNPAASFPELESKDDEDPSLLVYQRFLEEHSCYDVMPTSCRLVVFDTMLPACKAFNALILNSVRSAPLWDAKKGLHIGMLTVTDFIKVIVSCHKSPVYKVETIEDLTLSTWRKILNLKPVFTSVNPGDTLLHSLHILLKNHFHGVPVVDERSVDVFHIINYKRILRFLYLFISEIPMPRFMKQRLGECKIGTYKNVATVTKNHTLLDALQIVVDQQLTALPVVNEIGDVVDVFCKLDIIPLAAHRMYHHLDMKLSVALSYRHLPLVDDSLLDESGNSPHSIRSTPNPASSPNPKPSSLSSHLDYYSHRTEQRKSAVRGHTLIRPGNNNNHHQNSPTPLNKHPTSPLATNKHHHGTGNKHHPTMATSEPSVTPSRTRHNSFSNPLVKCKLTDSLLYVIDRLVSTEANLLVVVKETSDKMVGVVTVSDVLRFITGFKEDQPSPTLPSSRCSESSDQSLPLGSTGELVFGDFCSPDNTLFEGSTFSERSRKVSDSSTHMMNDSGYSSSSTMRLRSNNFDSKSFKGQVLKVGAEMDRA